MTAELDDGKAEAVVVVDLRGKTSFADYMVIASGTSTRQVQALAQRLDQRLSALKPPRLALEGMAKCDWVLIDAGDVIIHLFRPEVRAFYNLEKMWAVPAPDAPPAEAYSPIAEDEEDEELDGLDDGGEAARLH